MKNEISLQKLKGIHFDDSYKIVEKDNSIYAMSLNAEMMRLGYIMTSELFSVISHLSKTKISKIANEIIHESKKMKGADVEYQSMYPNFPRQVMEASWLELWLNAMIHYWSHGQWIPEYKKIEREFAIEEVDFIQINQITSDEFMSIFTTILKSNDSISNVDKEIMEWFLNNYSEKDLKYPAIIPFKENMCIVAHSEYEKGRDISNIIKTSTDLLRLITYMNHGDISLAENTKFKSLPRRDRKYFVKLLEKVITEEDIRRHKNKWGKLFHNLHVGDYSEKVYNIAKKVRENKKLYSVNSKVEEFIKYRNYLSASELLMKRPGEFARKLDFLLRKSSLSDRKKIVGNFKEVIDKVSTKVLVQALGHFKDRDIDHERIVFPKGATQKAILLDPIKEKISVQLKRVMIFILIKELRNRFAELHELGNVWIDERLKKCPLPSQQRSASGNVVARGTRLPIGKKNTLRFFIYWVGRDIDLSATFHDENFKMVEKISYNNLRSVGYNSCHSGDITYAPNGASEFIDIDITSALNFGARYVAMNVLVFAGPTFKEHTKCYAGYMTRSIPKSNEIYDPKTVEVKIDLTSNSKNAIPAVFDLKTREMIWCDLTTPRRFQWSYDGMTIFHSGNNVESNRASIEQVLKMIANLHNKMNLYHLFKVHGLARGTVVYEKEDADTVFDLEMVKEINTINSEYLV